MNYKHILVLGLLAVLTACGDSSRPVYSGKEESTEGVPGFKGGKKVSPHVKLGQSYTVNGETYVPRNQPDYVEEGMASWYGPGFHGGKTANGEKFDSSELTAAHRTLPLPSIVRVTMLSTGKQVYARVNDRGPFAHSRIIDLSRGAAEKIGLLRAGVGKVRVEYMAAESQRFVDLLEQGRDPKSIDIASEVLNYNSDGPAPRTYARGDVRTSEMASNDSNANVWQAEEEISQETMDAAPVGDVVSSDLTVSTNVSNVSVKKAQSVNAPIQTAAVAQDDNSPFSAMDAQAAAPTPAQEAAMVASQSPAAGGTYVQLGAFQNQANAEKLGQKYATMGPMNIVKKPNSQGVELYHVRMGPYSSTAEGQQALAKLQSAGAEAKIIHE